MGRDNITYESDGEILVDGVKIEEAEEAIQLEAFSYAIQCFVGEFGKSIPNLLDIGISTLLSQKSDGSADGYFVKHQIGSVQMGVSEALDRFIIEGIDYSEYIGEDNDSLFDYIIDSLKRNEFKNTIFRLLENID